MATLSETARRLLSRAASEALRRGRPQVEVELVLLAILQELPELRARLRGAGLDVDGYERRLDRVLPWAPARRGRAAGISATTARALRIASGQAALLGHDRVGPEHLLLAILADGESWAARFLKGAPPAGSTATPRPEPP
jgi:ATP-dependent Clp protease ATP-binding subunit ClpC